MAAILSGLGAGVAWLWENVISDQGVANILSVSAICLSGYVFIREQRSARIQERRERDKLADQRTQFVNTVRGVIAEAVRMIEAHLGENPYDNPNHLADYRALAHVIEPIQHVVDTLQHAAPADGHLIITISRAHRSLQDLVDPKRAIGPIAHAPQYRAMVVERRDDLFRRSEQIGRLSAIGSRLSPDEVATAIEAVAAPNAAPAAEQP